MTKGKLSAKQTNEQKWKRMRLILDKLREESLSISEVGRLVYGSKMTRTDMRTVQNYLAELVGIGLVSKPDDNSGVYSSTENKIIFQSAAEYSLALKHSKNMLLSDEHHQGIEDSDEEMTLRRLAFFEEDRMEWKKHSSIEYYDYCYLQQHIKTGYLEIHELIRKYKQLATEKGVESGFGHLRIVPTGEMPAPKQTITEEDKKEFVDVTDLFVGKLSRLIRAVSRDGVPLAGYCDGCPGRKIIIKGSGKPA